jgi:hypothetical protein
LGGRGGNLAKQHKGPYSVAEYVANSLLQDLGMNQVKFQIETAYVSIKRQVASQGVVDYNVGARICYSL